MLKATVKFISLTVMCAALFVFQNVTAQARCVGVTIETVGQAVGPIKKHAYARARRRAERQWSRTASRRYGSAFANFGYAMNTNRWCEPKRTGELYRCHVYGQPCDRDR